MKLIYTVKSKNLPEGYLARNPRYFISIEPDVETVVIEGDYPEIAKAYRSAEVEVFLGEVKEMVGTTPSSEMTVPELKQRLTDQGVEFSPKATKAQLIALMQE